MLAKIGLTLFNVGFGSVNTGLDQVISVWIGYYQSRLVNKSRWIKYKKVLVNIGKDRISVKCWLRLTNIDHYLDRLILTNYRLILTNFQLRMTKTDYVVV